MNTPQQAAGYQNLAMRFVLKASPPNVFIGGPVPNLPVVSPVEPPLKACGNDGLRIGNLLNAASSGDRATEIEFKFFEFVSVRGAAFDIRILDFYSLVSSKI